MSTKTINSILYCWFCSLLVLAVLVSCSYIKYIRFSQNNKSVKTYKKHLLSKDLTLNMVGTYVYYGPKLDMGLKITLKYKPNIDVIDIRPENISISFNNRKLALQSPPIDSTLLGEKSNKYILYSYFNVGRFERLNSDEIKSLRETQFPLKISLDNFIFVNDTAIVIDTILATSPKL